MTQESKKDCGCNELTLCALHEPDTDDCNHESKAAHNVWVSEQIAESKDAEADQFARDIEDQEDRAIEDTKG